MTPAKCLTQYWIDQGFEVTPGVSAAAVEAFETQHGVRLPQTAREYFMRSSGLSHAGSPGGVDKRWIEFWPLWRLERIGIATIIQDGREHETTGAFFLFADSQVRLWHYAMDLAVGARQPGRVVRLGEPIPVVIADSFDRFVHMYINADSQVY